MPSNITPADQQRLDRVVAEARRNRDEREHTYREKALKLYPWVCGRCRREFTRENLRELTVHHKDHNHDNNPPDGSNWELLCLFCHDNEHARQEAAGYGDTTPGDQGSSTTFKAFAGHEAVLQSKDKG